MSVVPARIDLATRLRAQYAGLDGAALLRPMIECEFPGRIAAVSSFGAEAAVLLHLVARVDPATPVIFLDTGKHFPETLAYRDELVRHLGLSEVRVIVPQAHLLDRFDTDGSLWRGSPDRCCHLRKVAPLRAALTGFGAWITGRKRAHGGARVGLETLEEVDGLVKLNPLAGWDEARVQAEYRRAGLPRHPLVAEGYSSIGCAPCTHKADCGAETRAGRWAGSGKTECGIHWPSYNINI